MAEEEMAEEETAEEMKEISKLMVRTFRGVGLLPGAHRET